MSLLQSFDTPVRREQIRALYQQSWFLLLGIVFVMVVVAAFFWERADRELLLAWLTASSFLTAARVALVRNFHRYNPDASHPLRWAVLFAVSSTISGMLWGSIAFLFLQVQDIDTVLLVATALSGMTAGSLVPLSAFLPAYYGFTLFTLSPMAFVMLTNESNVLIFIGVLVLAFMAVNLGYSFVVHRNLAESIRLRFENLDLLESLKQQKNLAERANTDKSRFLAATSHDLRQPLHAMDLYLGALEHLMESDDQKQLLDKSLQASMALNHLLTALMDVSRLDAGEVVIERKPVNIRQLLSVLADEFREQAQQLDIELEVDAPSVFVDTDPLMFSRMLRNLLDNACNHSGASGILLQAEVLEHDVQVSVRDNGCGIPADQQQHVFSEFYQLNNPERDRDKGLGLGLAIVKRLADLLQHELTLQSSPGNGCCFLFQLPRVASQEEMESNSSNAPEDDISGSFVVLIEDEANVRDAMRSLLRQWGCELLISESVEALKVELLSRDYPPPDIVIADYRLRKNTTGLDAIQWLREHYGTALPALVISGDTDKSVQTRTDRHGCLLMHKPVTPGALRDALTRIQKS